MIATEANSYDDITPAEVFKNIEQEAAGQDPDIEVPHELKDDIREAVKHDAAVRELAPEDATFGSPNGQGAAEPMLEQERATSESFGLLQAMINPWSCKGRAADPHHPRDPVSRLPRGDLVKTMGIIKDCSPSPAYSADYRIQVELFRERWWMWDKQLGATDTGWVYWTAYKDSRKEPLVEECEVDGTHPYRADATLKLRDAAGNVYSASPSAGADVHCIET